MAKEKCPNCGYCPHCGRSNSVYPKPWYPYNPPYWYGTRVTSGSDSNVVGKGWSGTGNLASATFSS